MGTVNKNKRLLIIGAGAEQVPAYEFALKMGLIVVGSDRNINAPAYALTNEKIIASTYDAEETVREVVEYNKYNPIDGIITLANDASTTVARVAKELGLNSVSIETALLTSNKLHQLDKFKKDGIAVPEYQEISTSKELDQIIREWKYPVIIKPPDSRGARGVLRLTKEVDVNWAFRKSLSYSGTGKILVQKYIEGYQISSETLVVNGKCYTAMYSGRNYEYLDKFSPYVIENGGCLPADISEVMKIELDRVLQKVATSLGLTNGPLKGDLVLSKDGVVVIEFASRMGGGYAVSHSIPQTHGVNLIEQVIKMSLGDTINIGDLIPKYKQSTAIRFFFTKPGIVKEINGFEDLNQYDWIVHKQMYCKIGDILEEVTNHTKRAGCLIVVGKDRQEAEERVKKAIDTVEIVTE